MPLRRQKLQKSALAGRHKRHHVAPAPASPGAPALIDALRAWRAAQARAQGVPAYVILHDKTLHELAAARPASRVELLDVPGIGQAKAERYGADLLVLLERAAG
jgi:ATP-dependent DNA helicase RecQ